ncbi:MAG: hypothetical protein A2X49_01480 [Lentisphaerae bacterium GWF2_52_8]|nr:MAG: hypothetical protein A2X49_01480 [Lentisphaerae bacterium GWF2_52_8]
MDENLKTETFSINLITPNSIAADTHPGLIRETNEDCFASYVGHGHRNALVSVADGIGGHESGDLASNLCIRLIISSWRERKIGGGSATPEQAKAFFNTVIPKANDALYELNEKYQIPHPMGTTLVAGIFLPETLVLAHAGDSRCYRLRDGALRRLTNDHSFVAELVRKKVITSEEAQFHPFAHIISKSVGPSPNLSPEINSFERLPGDRYIFCSDGLTNHVDDPEIEKFLIEAKTPHEAVRSLMNSSLRGGGEDNVTIVCVFG